MAEAYKVTTTASTFTPPAPATPTKIDMPVTSANSPPSPVTKIVARQGTTSSWEREVTPRYADIYFNSAQFTLLTQRIQQNKNVYVTYNAPAIAGDDQITQQSVTTSYP